MAATRTQREPGGGPSAGGPFRVIDASTPEAEARYEELVSAAPVDRRLLRGPFASNVWGGRYEIDGFGGAGGQGSTFTGVDRKTGARVAVKLFDLGKAREWKSQELFDREVRTLQRLSHKGIPAFLDVVADEETGARALVMTHIAGDPLGAVLKRDGSLPEKRLWSLLVDLAHILAHLHGEGVVHRDLKPDNLILRPDGTVALVDFGGVGVVRAKAGSTVVGTFGFMAPEQLYGAQTPATDLYALGATVLTLATGKDPEEHPRNGLAIDVDAATPFLSESLRVLLKKLLAPDPHQRPKDGAALLLELKAVAAGQQTTASGRHVKQPDAIYDDGSVAAIWRDSEERRRQEADDAMKAAEGGLGVLAAVIAMLATVGLGRVLVPLILTIVAVFSDKETAKKLTQLRDTVESKARLLQEEIKQQGLRSAQKLEELSEKDRHRRQRGDKRADKRARRLEALEREAQRIEQKIEKQRRKQEWWK